MKQSIYAIIEPTHRDSALCAKSMAGLKTCAGRIGVEVHPLASVEELPANIAATVVVVVSLSMEWTSKTVETLRRRNIKAVLLGVLSEEYDDVDVSGPALNRYRLVLEMVGYFVHAGRKKLASVGNESHDINDITRRKAFLDGAVTYGLQVSEVDVYDGDRGVVDCVERFLANAHRYDGAVCVNDYVAVELMARAKQYGIRVPEDLYVSGSGNFRIGSLTNPTLTTSTLDYEQMGILAAEIWHLLSVHPSVEKIQLFIPCSIIVRASTDYHAPVKLLAAPRLAPFSSPVHVEVSQPALKKFEEFLLRCDHLDLKLLDHVAQGHSVESVASALFISPGTVNYRLKNAYQSLGIKNKNALAAFLRTYDYHNEADCPRETDDNPQIGK